MKQQEIMDGRMGFKSDEKYRKKMLGILVTIVSLNISQTCVLPSLSSYLSTFHATTPILGFCISAVAIGEFCTAKIWESLLRANPRDPIIISLIINAVAMLLYGVAPNVFVLIGSRFLVGCASGIQWGLLDLACSLTDIRSRAPLLVSLRFGAYTVAFILGMGIAAVASFEHSSPRGGLGDIHHDLSYPNLSPGGASNSSSTASMGSMASFTLGSMEISPNAGGVSRRLLESGDGLGTDSREPSIPGGGGGRGGRGFMMLSSSTARKEGKAGSGAAVVAPATGTGAGTSGVVVHSSNVGVKAAAKVVVGKGLTSPAEVSDRAHKGGKEGLTKAKAKAMAKVVQRAGAGGGGGEGRGSKGGEDEVGDAVSSAKSEISSDIANGISDAEETAARVKHDIHSVTRATNSDLGIGMIKVHDAKIPTENDDEIAHKVGKHMYMPTYITAVVGHGMAAPAYASVLISICTAVTALQVLGNIDPARSSASTLPPSAVGPRGLRMLLPLSGLVLLEFLSQVCSAATDTLVAPTTQVYFGWTLDASAVFMLGMCASGIVGLGVSEGARPHVGVRRILGACTAAVMLSFGVCIPWGGELSTWQYTAGCFLMSFAAVPMSAFAVRVFTAGAVKAHGDDLEAGWMILMWQVTGFPARILAPILIAFAMELNEGAAPNYIGLMLCSGVCLVLFLQSQRGATQTMEEGGEAWRGGEGSERGGLREPLSVEGGNYGSFNTNSHATGTMV